VLGMAIALASGYQWLFVVSVGGALVAALLPLLVQEPARAIQRGARPRLFLKSALTPGLMAMFPYLCNGAISSFIPLYAVKQGLENPGFYLLVMSAASFLAQTVAGSLSDRFGRLSVIIPSLALVAGGTALIAPVSGWWLMLPAVVTGLGFGSILPVLYAMAIDRAKQDERGSAIATVGMAIDAGMCGGPIIGGLLADAFGLSPMFLAFAVAPAAGLIFATLSSRAATPRTPQPAA
jgi:MFS family permease